MKQKHSFYNAQRNKLFLFVHCLTCTHMQDEKKILGMCKSRIFNIKFREKNLNFDSYIDFSVSDYWEF